MPNKALPSPSLLILLVSMKALSSLAKAESPAALPSCNIFHDLVELNILIMTKRG